MPQVVVDSTDLSRLAEYTANTQWLLENMDSLRKKLPDRYVAVSEGGKRLIDATTMKELLDKLSKAGVQPEICAIQFITRQEYVLIV
jgi:hypothetical protein